MLTREEIAEIVQHCKENGGTYKSRLKEIGIPEVVTAHLQVFRDLHVRDTGFLQMKKLLDLTHVNDCSRHITLPFLISAKLGDLTRWWPTMLQTNRAPAVISSGFCSFYLSFCRWTSIVFGLFQAGINGRP